MSVQSPTPTTATRPDPDRADLRNAGPRLLAVLRILLGFTFLWAFLDKTFGLGHATPAAKAWVGGGSLTTASSVASTSVRCSRCSGHGRAAAWPTGCS